jgi:hypothetical protein
MRSDIQIPAVDLSPIVDLLLFLFDLMLLFAVQLFCLGAAFDVPFFCPSVIRYSAIPPFDNSPFGYSTFCCSAFCNTILQPHDSSRRSYVPWYTPARFGLATFSCVPRGHPYLKYLFTILSITPGSGLP